MFRQRLSLNMLKGSLTSWLVLGGMILLLVTAWVAAQARFAQKPAASANAIGVTPYLGTDLKGIPAPNFTLHDQSGAAISLDQLRGHPVALTFFDSVCPHQDCSLMAQYVNATASDLGPKDTSAVVWLAVSLNPWHDTPESAVTFLKTRQVRIPLHYLLGTEQALAPVWKAYHMQSILQSDGVVIHSTGLFLLDGSGKERTFFEEGFDPKVASKQLHQLLTTSGTITAPGATSSIASSAFTGVATDQGYRIALTATPGEFGTYDFTVTVQDPGGTPLQGAAVALKLTMPAMPMSPLVVQLQPIEPPVPGSYQARGVLSMVGVWQASASVTTSGSSRPLTATFVFTAQFS